MTLTEFFAEIGNDHLRFQLLEQSMTDIRAMRRGTLVSFATDAITTAEATLGAGRVGLIVWADRAAYERAAAKANQATPT
ncbi:MULTISPECIES: hypothetical protein [pseudomallei group]|uniref:Uncharacterized protein n=1 Tax=Burkholderia thailandensis TaxID=57975 RepID=A0AAW9D224_BURTH|nr:MULTISPECIES: hypothetical protein [pseudomallei group]ARM00527.1 hypothetical protein BOC59_11135 [Burkholderia pseudomallei]MCS3399900.1 hypothetical protein [Burkholderia thailandensis]MCS6428840.1 hypothetical protein [Burkholderia thailandensis]MCS6451555.1 hypothetical protein [Burkholderia thailandensis]MCS6467867.1 hypothetical protein [Burkholderia thailandensis]